MSAREVANMDALRQHREGCERSNQEHLKEMEKKLIESLKYTDEKLVEFWARKRRNTQTLRDKSSNQL